MDKKIVGVNAGKVWQALNEVTEISIGEHSIGSRLAGKRRPDQHRAKEWNYRVAAKERLYV